MRYEERPAPAPLVPYVEALWSFEVGEGGPDMVRHVIVPDGTASLSVADLGAYGRRVTLSGPSQTAYQVEIRPGFVFRGARLRAGALRAALGIDIAALAGRMQPLAVFDEGLALAIDAGYRRDAGLEGFGALLANVLRPDPARLDPEVDALTRAIIAAEGEAALSDLMAGGGVGPRQLRRRFVSETGLTPKTFARLRRVRRACVDLALGRPGEVARVSADNGYADQPHFTREMKAVFDMSPDMVRAYLSQVRHGDIQP